MLVSCASNSTKLQAFMSKNLDKKRAFKDSFLKGKGGRGLSKDISFIRQKKVKNSFSAESVSKVFRFS
jgi:hypothetical protein